MLLLKRLVITYGCTSSYASLIGYYGEVSNVGGVYLDLEPSLLTVWGTLRCLYSSCLYEGAVGRTKILANNSTHPT